MKALLLLGGGGHCRACIDVIEASSSFIVRGVVERQGMAVTGVMGYPVLGTDSDLESLLAESPHALVSVGQVASPHKRVRLFQMAVNSGAQFPVIASPYARISRRAELGFGTIAMHGSVINTGADVGLNCIVNSQALVEHDVRIGPHCHISTGAIINGGAVIGERSFVGSGAIVHQGVEIGPDCVIASGAIVRRNLAPMTTYVER